MELEVPALTDYPTLSPMFPRISPPSHALVISEGTIEDDHHSKDVTSAITTRNEPVTTQQATAYNDFRPVLVILVGPSKTATTTLQTHLLSDPQTQADLRKDNYLYLGRCAKRKSKQLLHTLNEEKCKGKAQIAREQKETMPECRYSFMGELDRLYHTRHNVGRKLIRCML